MAPYIAVHRGATMVVHVCGSVLEQATFETVMQDLVLMHVLGIQLVVVAGATPQINARLRAQGLPTLRKGGARRVTGETALTYIKDAAGFVRVQIESTLGKGLTNWPGAKRKLGPPKVTSGNFVTARPIGVRDGIDYHFSGEVRRIDVDKIQRHLRDDDIVLLSNLGFASTGDVFNCCSEEVAAAAAVQLGAAKLVFLHDGEELRDAAGRRVHYLPLDDARRYARELQQQLLARPDRRRGSSADSSVCVTGSSFGADGSGGVGVARGSSGDCVAQRDEQDERLAVYLSQAVEACARGVKRAHLVSRHSDGALLVELFNRDGSGLLISCDMYEGVRRATEMDLNGIAALLEPLIAEGVLRRHEEKQIADDVLAGRFFVVELDGAVIATTALRPFGSQDAAAEQAEVGCIAVHPKYQSAGKGNALLSFVLQHAKNQGVASAFALTTRTSHWFIERGFVEGRVEDLPREKQEAYDVERNSLIYTIDLQGDDFGVAEDALLRLV